MLMRGMGASPPANALEPRTTTFSDSLRAGAGMAAARAARSATANESTARSARSTGDVQAAVMVSAATTIDVRMRGSARGLVPRRDAREAKTCTPRRELHDDSTPQVERPPRVGPPRRRSGTGAPRPAARRPVGGPDRPACREDRRRGTAALLRAGAGGRVLVRARRLAH